MTPRVVEGHDRESVGVIRPVVATLAEKWRLWDHLPGRVQGALCGCSICRGEDEER